MHGTQGSNPRLFTAPVWESLNGSQQGTSNPDSSSSSSVELANGAPRLTRSDSIFGQNWSNLKENAQNAYSAQEPSESEFDSGKKPRGPTRSMGRKFKDTWGRLQYSYYNWRKDTGSDLLLFLFINIFIVLLFGFVKGTIVDVVDGALNSEGGDRPSPRLWTNIYEVLIVVFGQEFPDSAANLASQVLIVVFGQEFPDSAANLASQVFSLAVATCGLAAFALVLALVEQLVLEVLEDNVKRGSKVYEKGHILVMGFCQNQRDLECVWKILSQMCLAYKNDGGRVVVVMTCREKLEMEATFRRIIPETARFGTSFVFRQGSPLVPDDLRMVSASAAASTMIVSDSSRSPQEADAQALRTAVLLDELDFPGFGVPDKRTGSIIVEMKTANAVKLVTYACSSRILALPTAQLNARRISRMVVHPVVGSISLMLWSFSSKSQAYLEPAWHMTGKKWSELHYYYPDGIVFGLVNKYTRNVQINPPAYTVVVPGDEVLVNRPSSFRMGTYRPALTPKKVDVGDWTPEDYQRRSYDDSMLRGSDPAANYARMQALSGRPSTGSGRSSGKLEGSQRSGMFMLPIEYSPTVDEPEKVLICGWAQTNFMTMLLRELDHGPAALPRGSELTLFNMREAPVVMGSAREKAGIRNLSLLHVPGNPLEKVDLQAKLDITKYKCAIVLCDESWVDPDLDLANGIELGEEGDMLRLDAMIMLVQLNIRALLEDAAFPEINIICEKVAFEGVTRFEDRYRLPLGISVNMSAFSATVMAEVSYNPKLLLPYTHLGEKNEMTVQDVSAFAAEGEELSFWQLQARALQVGQILYGFYNLPSSADQPIDMLINPEGDALRSTTRVWNKGDGSRKVITMTPKTVTGSVDDDEDALVESEPILVTASVDNAGTKPEPFSSW
ncbi:hypothetical protein WJX72_007697 [[Myrmecia] bisecta]|uniref:RCK N-terminal domain-containing protein n=1 Tax=[Myrmecia] bisecta TaxID=41462 RepID=A0AAW1Q848_9CHLO